MRLHFSILISLLFSVSCGLQPSQLPVSPSKSQFDKEDPAVGGQGGSPATGEQTTQTPENTAANEEQTNTDPSQTPGTDSNDTTVDDVVKQLPDDTKDKIDQAIKDAEEKKTVFTPLTEMPQGFMQCAGCHGQDGKGMGNYPSIAKSTFPEAFQIVRSGKGNMPQYEEASISNEDLAQAYANTSNTTVDLAAILASLIK